MIINILGYTYLRYYLLLHMSRMFPPCFLTPSAAHVPFVSHVKRIFSLEYGGRAAYVETHGMVLTPSVGISGRL